MSTYYIPSSLLFRLDCSLIESINTLLETEEREKEMPIDESDDEGGAHCIVISRDSSMPYKCYFIKYL